MDLELLNPLEDFTTGVEKLAAKGREEADGILDVDMSAGSNRLGVDFWALEKVCWTSRFLGVMKSGLGITAAAGSSEETCAGVIALGVANVECIDARLPGVWRGRTKSGFFSVDSGTVTEIPLGVLMKKKKMD